MKHEQLMKTIQLLEQENTRLEQGCRDSKEQIAILVQRLECSEKNLKQTVSQQTHFESDIETLSKQNEELMQTIDGLSFENQQLRY